MSRQEPPQGTGKEVGKETAIALTYDGRDVPRVIAKGKGELAQRMVELAEAHDIPLHEDPELSAALARIDLGTSIPPELYQAVAEVLSFALYLSGKHEEILRRVRGEDESGNRNENE